MVQNLMEIVSPFKESRIILSAVELGLFDEVFDKSKTAEEIAKAKGYDLRAVKVLLNVLTSMKILSKENERYILVEELKPQLSDNLETSVVPMLKHSIGLWKSWSNMSEIVRGTHKPEMDWLHESEDEDKRAFINAMHVASRHTAHELVPHLNLKKYRTFLDVGGASGTYTIEFLKSNSKLSGTLFDLPFVIEMAKERIKNENLLDRTTLVAGNYHKDILPSGNDMVFLSSIAHQNSAEENDMLYKKTYDALNEGGEIIIRDHVMDDDHTEPYAGAIFAVNMLCGTEGGGTYSYKETEQSLKKAGFSDVKMNKTNLRMGNLIIGKK